MTDMPALVVAAQIPQELRQHLAGRYRLVEIADLATPAAGYRVVVTNSLQGCSAAQMALLPDLALITCNGTGTDKIDLAEAARRGIAVKPTTDAVTQDTADFAIALIYAVVRRVAEADRFIRADRWGPERMTASVRVSGMTAGIVGLGRIGQLVARRAEGIGLTVRYTGPSQKAGVAYPFDETPAALAANCDIVVLTCPGGEATHHLVNAAVLTALGPKGYLVNVSRGTVVDEAALLDTLSRGAIAGAGLDVFEGEPAVNPAFKAFDNVVLTPHIAAVTNETRQAMAVVIGDAIDAYFET